MNPIRRSFLFLLINFSLHPLRAQEGPNPKGFHFSPVIDLEATPVKNQHRSGTCWSYSTTSFLESEMIRAGRKPVDLSELFTVRNAQIERAKMYVRLHGAAPYTEGGELHDPLDMYRKYGAVPYSVYTGLHYGSRINRFGELESVLRGILKGVIKNKNGTLSTAWLKAFTAALDSYLGPYPRTFFYQGKPYTPKTFAREVVGLNPDDYIEFTSWADEPSGRPVLLTGPDNWSYERAWNLPFEEMTEVVDRALRKGYTVAWGADVTEPGFSKEKGIAYVAEESVDGPRDGSPSPSKGQSAGRFDGPRAEPEITAKMRRRAYDDYRTTEDHAMQIVGLVKDQNGKVYYRVKNSWGTRWGYQGYLYVTQAYFRYKTLSFLLNKKALTRRMRRRIARYKPYGKRRSSRGPNRFLH